MKGHSVLVDLPSRLREYSHSCRIVIVSKVSVRFPANLASGKQVATFETRRCRVTTSRHVALTQRRDSKFSKNLKSRICSMSGATTTSLSRSRSRVTPIRAIPSNLSTRSSPSVPPATQNYEPLLKSVLRHRLIYNIFACSALCSWIIAVISTLWFRTSNGILGVLLSPLRPSTLLFAAAYWAVGVLPIVVLRKLYLTGMNSV